MIKNTALNFAKSAKNSDFYTPYELIETEINTYLEYDIDAFRNKVLLLACNDSDTSNFTRYFAQKFSSLGLKKLIAVSYAPISNGIAYEDYKPTSFEVEKSNFDIDKSYRHGKVFTLTNESSDSTLPNFSDIKFQYLEGDGDFRSNEITTLRDEADILITNPPFSLFLEFIKWIFNANKPKKFLILGNMNSISCKEIFPLVKENKIWLGVDSGSKSFFLPDGSEKKMGNTVWFTNMEHGRRHKPLQLMTIEDNLIFSTQIRNTGYQKYDNYDAIEVPNVNSIPSDYQGIMGVPISFLLKYNPKQFKILGTQRWAKDKELVNAYCDNNNHNKDARINGKTKYDRVFIKLLKKEEK